MDDHTRPKLKPRTLACQALGAGDATTRAIVPSIHMSTTYLRDADNGYSGGHVYGSADNVTVHQAEALISALEHADETMLFSSGMAAATTLFLSLPGPTHIIASRVMYWGLRSWLQDLSQYGHTVTFVETSDLEAVRAAVRPGETGLFWIETPSNPLWSVTDIAAISEIAHEVDALLCVDSTVSTPVLTQPITHGADVVVHSATKYLNGHSDIVAGALAVAHPNDFWRRIRKVRGQMGNALSPFEAWLLIRGMRTLNIRVREQSQTASTIAHGLLGHPALHDVLYPGLKTHPGHDIASRQMKGGFGGMLSLRVRDGEAAAVDVAARVRVWKRATSLGGVESLIEHRASIEGPGTPCPGDLLRLSVGLEDPDDLMMDLVQSLDTLG